MFLCKARVPSQFYIVSWFQGRWKTCLFSFLFQKFASEGLRTLVLGVKDLTQELFDEWKTEHHKVGNLAFFLQNFKKYKSVLLLLDFFMNYLFYFFPKIFFSLTLMNFLTDSQNSFFKNEQFMRIFKIVFAFLLNKYAPLKRLKGLK